MKYIFSFFITIFLSQISLAQDIEIWGTTTSGGNGFGTIFKTDGNGENHEVMHEFQGISVRFTGISEFVEVDTGLLFATAVGGGEYMSGGLFSYNYQTRTFKKHYDFNDDKKTGFKAGTLTLMPDGIIYGTTLRGGTGDKGTIWKYDRGNEEYIKLFDFDTATIGYLAITGLLLANDGMLYGVAGEKWFRKTAYIFRIDPSTDQLTKLYATKDSSDGFDIRAKLMQGSNGKLYGTSNKGGKYDKGVIFEFDLSDSTWTTKHHFNDTCGRNPLGYLTEAGNGRCFGTTPFGGIKNNGVFYEYDFKKDTFICHMRFPGSTLGAKPYFNNVRLAKSGKLYGMTTEGGGLGTGALFEFDTSSNKYTIIHSFRSSNAGIGPAGTLLEAYNGKFYGATDFGTYNLSGSIFSYDVTYNTVEVLDYFMDRSQGRTPTGKLLDHSNGLLYGTTEFGGDFDVGVLYSFNPSSKIYQVLVHFNSKVGEKPSGYLIEGKDGLIYGTTSHGGKNGDGVIFSFDPISLEYNYLVEFKDEITGRNARGGLIGYSDGKYYGLNFSWGTLGGGTIYMFDPKTNKLEIVHEFSAKDSLGFGPIGNLTQLPDGMMYGVIGATGLKYNGGIFSFNSSNREVNYIHQFKEDSTGSYPRFAPTSGPNNLLYGIAGSVLYSLNPKNNDFKVLARFSEDSIGPGRKSAGQLLWASNNKLYGTTTEGAAYNKGALFEYDPSTKVMTNKLDFNGEIGSIPWSTLTELNGLRLSVEESEVPKTNISIYPNPSGGRYEISFDSYQDEGFIEVLNLQGAILASYSIQNSKKEIIDISNLSSGLYLLHIQTSEINESVRIIKNE